MRNITPLFSSYLQLRLSHPDLFETCYIQRKMIRAYKKRGEAFFDCHPTEGATK